MERYLNLWAESLPAAADLDGGSDHSRYRSSPFALALLVGIISAGARTSRFAPVNWLAWQYILGLPRHPAAGAAVHRLLRPAEGRIALDVWSAAIITMSLYTGAYVAENLPLGGGGYSARPV